MIYRKDNTVDTVTLPCGKLISWPKPAREELAWKGFNVGVRTRKGEA